MSRRSEELDNMDLAAKKVDIMKNLTSHGTIRIDNRSSMEFWGEALNALESEDKVTSEFIENYDQQYSYVQVKIKD